MSELKVAVISLYENRSTTADKESIRWVLKGSKQCMFENPQRTRTEV